MYLVIVVCCTNLSLTWERAKRGVWELLEELSGKKQFKARGSAWDQCHSSVVFFGAVSSCCKPRGFGGLHTHTLPPALGILQFRGHISFHHKSIFFSLVLMTTEKWSQMWPCRLKNPTERTQVNLKFISWLILELTCQFILLERPT